MRGTLASFTLCLASVRLAAIGHGIYEGVGEGLSLLRFSGEGRAADKHEAAALFDRAAVFGVVI